MKKSVIITGASSGIGEATALRFSQAGYFVYLAGRNEERLTNVALQCHHGAALLKVNFEKPESISKYADHLATQSENDIVGLINNAGIFERADFEKSPMELWTRQFQVNFLGHVHWTQAVLPFLSKGAAITNVASTLGLRPVKGTSAYSAAKAAMINWSQCLALELAERQIRVNCVCPGVVDTPIHPFHRLGDSEKLLAIAPLQQMHPLGRIGRPEEIAESIFFLSTPASSWTTGAILTVDGGINLASS